MRKDLEDLFLPVSFFLIFLHCALFGEEAKMDRALHREVRECYRNTMNEENTPVCIAEKKEKTTAGLRKRAEQASGRCIRWDNPWALG